MPRAKSFDGIAVGPGPSFGEQIQAIGREQALARIATGALAGDPLDIARAEAMGFVREPTVAVDGSTGPEVYEEFEAEDAEEAREFLAACRPSALRVLA